MTILAGNLWRSDFFRIRPGFCQSDAIRSSPGFVNPIRSGPGFVNTHEVRVGVIQNLFIYVNDYEVRVPLHFAK